MANNIESDKLIRGINTLFDAGKLRSHRCKVYSKNSQPNSTEKCACQRSIRHHSFAGDELPVKPTRDEWAVEHHAEQLNAPIYRSTPNAKVSE